MVLEAFDVDVDGGWEGGIERLARPTVREREKGVGKSLERRVGLSMESRAGGHG